LTAARRQPDSACRRNLRRSVAEQLALLDGRDDGRRHHLLPGFIVLLDAPQDVPREDVQDASIVANDTLDVMILEQMIVEIAEMIDDLDVLRVDQNGGSKRVRIRGARRRRGLAGTEVMTVGVLPHRINVEFDRMSEETT